MSVCGLANVRGTCAGHAFLQLKFAHQVCCNPPFGCKAFAVGADFKEEHVGGFGTLFAETLEEHWT
eukprot:scaffold40614_cov15-Tisochrysis_lutea.AAC.2